MNLEVKEGHYARKQLRGGLDIISWSHRRRFETALSLAEELKGGALLDYGCGDGAFLGMVHGGQSDYARLVGAEIKRELVEDCRNRLASYEGLQFLCVDRLAGPEHTSRYDAIFCMEVLEHVVEVPAVLRHMYGLLSPNGRLIVSVPVETGPALLIKLLLRRLAAFRGCADYPGSVPYTKAELYKSLFAGLRQHIERPVHGNGPGELWHDHKGFNWRCLQVEIETCFKIVKKLNSPLRAMPAALSSQVWFVAKKLD